MEFRNRETRQWRVGPTGQFAREPFNVDDDAGGESGPDPASLCCLKAGQTFFKEALSPFADD